MEFVSLEGASRIAKEFDSFNLALVADSFSEQLSGVGDGVDLISNQLKYDYKKHDGYIKTYLLYVYDIKK
jgi:hypothetical protein